MQQPQFYKTVRTSDTNIEGSKMFGIFVGEDNKPVLTLYTKMKGGMWNGERNPGRIILEPIPIPDAEVLREALEKIAYKTGGSDDYVDMDVNTIALEALSQTGDGWIRVEEYDVPMVKHISNSHWITDGKDVYLAYKAGDNWFSKEDKKLPKAFIPTHIKPHTKPSPPQPINP